MKITNVEVSQHSDQFCLSWQFNHAHYHVWLSEKYEVQPAIGRAHKGPAIYKRVSGLSQKVSYLDATRPKNVEMVAQAKAEAVAQHLFEKAEADLKKQREHDVATRREQERLKHMQAAAPEMFKVLRAVAEFWSGEQKNYSLDPGALIMPEDSFFNRTEGQQSIVAKPSVMRINPDDHETIADAVRRVIALAETGGVVAL